MESEEKPPSAAQKVMGKAAQWAKRPLVWVGAAAVVGALIFAHQAFKGGGADAPYRTAQITTGAVTRVVSATGALEPLVKVNVGSTVSGPVDSVEVDFNSTVKAGQVLARLDPTSFQQRVVQAQANLSEAEAKLAVAEADYQRYVRLQASGFASDQLMQQQRAARDSARAAVDQTRASLASAQTDLARTVIRSPIDGVVVDRQVNPGQSVAASFQAPTLFVIAQDLSRLQANITVDEADIGEVRQGQSVKFTVDAYPDSQFDGRVSQVRQQGASESGVVSYTVVVEADNPNHTLLPGMTANAEIVIEQRDNVLRLPNAALRFRPADPKIEQRAEALTASNSGARAGEAQAQPASASGPPQGGGWQGGGPGGGQGGARGGRALAELTEQLQLTEAQQNAARDAARQVFMSGPRPGPDMSDADRRAMFRRVREASIAAIEPTLSPHQKELLEQMRSAPPGERREVRRQAVAWVLRHGEPTPVSIEVGFADSANVVLLGGDLKEGDEVIIGGGPAAKQENGGGFGGAPGGMRIRGI